MAEVVSQLLSALGGVGMLWSYLEGPLWGFATGAAASLNWALSLLPLGLLTGFYGASKMSHAIRLT